jgi:hypothetical protein
MITNKNYSTLKLTKFAKLEPLLAFYFLMSHNSNSMLLGCWNSPVTSGAVGSCHGILREYKFINGGFIAQK